MRLLLMLRFQNFAQGRLHHQAKSGALYGGVLLDDAEHLKLREIQKFLLLKRCAPHGAQLHLAKLHF